MVATVSNVTTTGLNLVAPTHEDTDPALILTMESANVALDAVVHDVSIVAYTPNF